MEMDEGQSMEGPTRHISLFACKCQDLIPKNAGNATAALTPRDLGVIGEDELFPWTVVAGERHTGTCGHDV